MCGQSLGNLVIDIAELRIAVGMVASLLGLAVTLKAVIETSEQLTDQRMHGSELRLTA